MKRTSNVTLTILKKLQSCAKAMARIPLLAAALLFSNSVAPAAHIDPAKKSINERVELVRATLKGKIASQQLSTSDLPYSERALSQWNNWGNWGNWNNWLNWNNWNNWRNWGNWGNWGNF